MATPKRIIVKRKMRVAGQEAGVFIAKARKAKVKKYFLTEDAKMANAESNKFRKMAIGRKISQSRGGGYELYYDGTKNPPTISSNVGRRGSKYTAAQIRQIPGIEAEARAWARISKKSARKSGGVATGIKRTAEAALGRIATGKALKASARKAGILGMVGMFMNELNGKKKRG